MLMIAPERCHRMTGSTCLQAMIVPRRLIADTRSNTASVSSSSGLSPPATLTPTLLCRISMRPQRARAASIATASVSILGHIGGEGHTLAALLGRHRSGFLGGRDEPVDCEDLRAFLREAERGCTPIPDPLSRT